MDRKPHLIPVVSCKDIAKVACGHYKIDFVTKVDFTTVHKVNV